MIFPRRICRFGRELVSKLPSTGRFEVGESSAVAAAREPRLDVTTVDATPGRHMSREIGYGIEYVWDDMVGDIEERAPTLEDLSQRVTGLAADLARDTHEMHVHFEDAQDNRAFLRAQVNTLFRDRRYHLHTAVLVESEARHARQAWSQSMDCNRAVHVELLACRVEVKAFREHASLLYMQRISDEDRLTRHIQHCGKLEGGLNSTDKAKITRKQSKTRQTRTRERKSTQKAGRMLSKSTLRQKGQFMGSSTRWQNLTSPNVFHWLIPSREDMLDDEKAQEKWDFTLLKLTKKEQGVSITDCHAGNPCEISSENDLPMIGRLYDYDQEERVTEMRTRRFT
ncbi:hypothetical protein Tco_0117840 [Tanacetum coccineum]